MKLYRRKEWRSFAEQVIKLHEGRCARCLTTRQQGSVLQVHHPSYVSGRKPWEYSYSECEVLCRGCHAKEHGIIMPTVGWEFIGREDLGDLSGNCDYCDTELRYIHLITHPNWGSLEVGTDCCDQLTGTTIASEYHREHNNRIRRRKSFIESPRWFRFNNSYSITYKEIFLAINKIKEGGYRISLNNIEGKIEHTSFLDAQVWAFDFIEDGQASSYLAERARKVRERRAEGNSGSTSTRRRSAFRRSPPAS